MINSKRFLIIIFSLAIFCIGIFIFKIEPIKLGGGLAAIITPYIVGQSYRKSDNIYKI